MFCYFTFFLLFFNLFLNRYFSTFIKTFQFLSILDIFSLNSKSCFKITYRLIFLLFNLIKIFFNFSLFLNIVFNSYLFRYVTSLFFFHFLNSQCCKIQLSSIFSNFFLNSRFKLNIFSPVFFNFSVFCVSSKILNFYRFYDVISLFFFKFSILQNSCNIDIFQLLSTVYLNFPPNLNSFIFFCIAHPLYKNFSILIAFVLFMLVSFLWTFNLV